MNFFLVLVAQISIIAEKRDSVVYSEKMSHVKFSPSVRGFGGGAGEGCIVMTGTGMVGGILLPKEAGAKIITAAESLAATRVTLSIVDISYGKSMLQYWTINHTKNHFNT